MKRSLHHNQCGIMGNVGNRTVCQKTNGLIMSAKILNLSRTENQRLHLRGAIRKKCYTVLMVCDWLNWTSMDSLHVKYLSARENKSLMYSKQSAKRSASSRHLGATWSGRRDDTICHHQVCKALAACTDPTATHTHSHHHDLSTQFCAHTRCPIGRFPYPTWIITGFRLLPLIEI